MAWTLDPSWVSGRDPLRTGLPLAVYQTLFLCSCPASTRKLYERKLQKLLDSDPAPSEDILPHPKFTSNGSAEPPELYSDQDDGELLLFPPENLLLSERFGTS